MKSLVTLVALIGLVLLTGIGWADVLPSAKPEEVGLSSQRLERIGQMLQRQIEKKVFPGAVALVARKGRVAYLETFGQLDPTAGTPMAKDAIFRLRSMTKPYTSVAAMMLMEEGRFRLSDPLSKFVPQIGKLEVAVQTFDAASGKASYATVPAEREITIHDLLRHTSGMAYAGFTQNGRVKELYNRAGVSGTENTPAEQIERLAKLPLAHQPGTAWEYGLSTDVLGRVIEATTGTTLGRFLEERLFTPLRMTDSAFQVPQASIRRLAQPFPTDSAGKPIKLDDVTVAPKNDSGGSGAVGTAMDYTRFLQMLLNGGQLDGTRLLSRTTVRYMTADHVGDLKIAVPFLGKNEGFGLGFAVRKVDGLGAVPGSAGEYSWGGSAGTHFWADPKEEQIAVLMTQAPFGPQFFETRHLFRQLVQQAIID